MERVPRKLTQVGKKVVTILYPISLSPHTVCHFAVSLKSTGSQLYYCRAMVKKMTILMPDNLHRELKETSFRKGTTMARIIIRAIKKSDDLSSNANQVKTKHITSVRKDDDDKGFLIRIPEDIAEKLRLTKEHHLYLTRMVNKVTKKRSIKIRARISWSDRPKDSYIGFVRAEKDGTFLASIPSDDAEKALLAQDGLKVRWDTYAPEAKLDFLDQGE